MVEVFGGVEQVVSKVRGEAGAIITAIVIFAVGVFIAYLVRGVMRRSLQYRLPVHVYKPLEALVFYSLLFLTGVSALYPFGVNLSGLLVAGGFAGIVVGLAAQSTLSNLVSGLMLLVEQPLRVGEPVSVAGVSGVVVGISVFSTRIRTWDGPVVRIPNNDVFNSIITNYVKMKARRIEFVIGVHYNTDIDYAIDVIKNFVSEHPLCLVNPGPEAFVDNYGDSSVNIKIRCWAPPQAWFATKVELQTKIKRVLEEAGIEIPYPQLDLHLVSQKDSLRVRLEEETGSGSK